MGVAVAADGEQLYFLFQGILEPFCGQMVRASMFLASFKKSVPSCVRFTVRVVRTKSFTFNSVSREWI